VALGEPKGAHSFNPSKPSLARREQGGNATKVCTTMHNQTTRGLGGGSHSPMGAHQGMGVGGGHGRAQGLLVSHHSLQAKAHACNKEGMPACKVWGDQSPLGSQAGGGVECTKEGDERTWPGVV
jgi:hypothetical protein